MRKSKNNYPRGRLQRGNSSSKNVFIYTKEVYVTLWYCIVNIHDSSSDVNFIPIWRIKALNEPLKLMKFILSYNFLNSKLIAALKDICQYFTISTIHKTTDKPWQTFDRFVAISFLIDVFIKQERPVLYCYKGHISDQFSLSIRSDTKFQESRSRTGHHLLKQCLLHM